MFRIVRFEPEIPPNTGNVIRLCANTGAALHLVRPLGFDLDRRSLRRAGLDYRWMARLHVHRDRCRTLGSGQLQCREQQPHAHDLHGAEPDRQVAALDRDRLIEILAQRGEAEFEVFP